MKKMTIEHKQKPVVIFQRLLDGKWKEEIDWFGAIIFSKGPWVCIHRGEKGSKFYYRPQDVEANS